MEVFMVSIYGKYFLPQLVYSFISLIMMCKGLKKSLK